MRGTHPGSRALLVVLLLAVITCSPAGQTVDSAPLTGDTIVLKAVRAYKPSHWMDGEITLDQPTQFTIPSFVPVVLGNGGNHWVEFRFRTPLGQELQCDYQGGSDFAHPQTAV